MTEINLLPWREQKREQEKKLFTTMLLIGIIIAAAIVFLMNFYVSHLISNQTNRNQILQKEITALDEQIKEIKALKQIREGLISRMSIVQNLQSIRTLMVHLFDELVRIIPPGIYITKIQREHDVITLWGYSESNTSVSILMRNIDADVWIQNPILTEIKKNVELKQSPNNEFKLSFVLKPKY
ncbi:TPA: pilus assembly protein PilN [Legionella pneumophila]|uniref:PilN domain-containing protein n=1 Tax=Legionella sp. PATHC039 TaxID=2992042 RepID=UPI00077825BB|nr:MULTISPECIES: PilN domain-containing protein [Legionella]HAT8858834.1 pilus assembly protein PilN [Legionella pneumophila subsp. pneumophila]MCW8395440.1 PilN domain-containing protein [Legionella sp. PATHC039]HAT7072086.1 pilus assembly protein PilN [Legionella pneumophila]HAT8642047.1 pilus assembly protein PilN [Legionella pneumophila]HAT8867913.1 pilus assembly protein PilN [Legionella pneumophila subsp. pneumophila]